MMKNGIDSLWKMLKFFCSQYETAMILPYLSILTLLNTYYLTYHLLLTHHLLLSSLSLLTFVHELFCINNYIIINTIIINYCIGNRYRPLSASKYRLSEYRSNLITVQH